MRRAFGVWSSLLASCSASQARHDYFAVADIKIAVKCETQTVWPPHAAGSYPVWRPEYDRQAVRVEASATIGWAPKLSIVHNYYIQLPQLSNEVRDPWLLLDTDLLYDGETYPASFVRSGYISFDGERVEARSIPPSMIRGSTTVPSSGSVRVNGVVLSDCAYVLLDTDFGSRRALRCKDVGTVAEDQLIGSTWRPTQRQLARSIHKFASKRYAVTESPPYSAGLLRLIEQDARGLRFIEACSTDPFKELLGGRSLRKPNARSRP